MAFNFGRICRSCSARIARAIQSHYISVCKSTSTSYSLYLTPALNGSRIPSSVGRNYSESKNHLSFTSRTHLCGELNKSHVGNTVKLCGWLHYNRMGHFIVLRDWHGSVQVIVPESHSGREAFKNLSFESVVEIDGIVQERPDGQMNKSMKTGEIEIILDKFRILNRCMAILPFELNKSYKAQESLRMEYRYLDIRTNLMQKNLRLRSQMIMNMREFLCKFHGFVDVETPVLFRRTPGGAKEFLVPSNHCGRFYSLPQSPQQFKQLLMVGGIDRYFQIAKCFRDEGSKPDRQPEFTQVDIEMSFVCQESILNLIENMLQYSWPDCQPPLQKAPFPQMKYEDAMKYYGIDKPDTRFDWHLNDVSDIFKQSELGVLTKILGESGTSVQCLKIPQGLPHLSTKNIDDILLNVQAQWKNIYTTVIKIKDDSWKSPLTKHLKVNTKEVLTRKLGLEKGDILVIAAGHNYRPNEMLGKLRLHFADFLESKGVKIRSDGFKFLWVIDFPLFMPKEEDDNILESAHHPFTAPHPGDEDILFTNPAKVRSQHFDLVLNGNEVGGGSIRIHNADQQKYVLESVLKEDSSEINHLLEALASGCPPHGGIALGLDRLIAIICGAESIRDVIAFPKSYTGNDLMSKAPTEVPQRQLDDYHITVKHKTL